MKMDLFYLIKYFYRKGHGFDRYCMYVVIFVCYTLKIIFQLTLCI